MPGRTPRIFWRITPKIRKIRRLREDYELLSQSRGLAPFYRKLLELCTALMASKARFAHTITSGMYSVIRNTRVIA